MPTPNRSALKTTLATALLLVVAVAMSFAMVEVAWRAMGNQPLQLAANPHFKDSWAQPDVELGWVNRPGTHRSIEAGEVPMTFTPEGARVSHPSGSKPDATYRMLLVGGSFMQGYGVTDEETAAWRLNDRNHGLRIDNFGTAGYGTFQSSLLLAREITRGDLLTKLVVYGFMTGHPERNVAPADWIRVLTDSTGRYVVPPHAALADEGIVEQPGGPVPVWPFETLSAVVATIHDRWLDYAYPSPSKEDKQRVTIEILKEMDRTARTHGASFLLANLDRSEPWLRELSERNGIRYADCSSEDMFDPKNRVGGTGHPNAIIHARWADCIQSAIEQGIDPARAHDASL